MADETHPVRPEFDNRHIDKSDRDYTRPIQSSFQRPFGHTINKKAGKHNTQRLEIGMRGRRGWDKMEECLGVNGRQLFVRVDCHTLEEQKHVLLVQCF